VCISGPINGCYLYRVFLVSTLFVLNGLHLWQLQSSWMWQLLDWYIPTFRRHMLTPSSDITRPKNPLILHAWTNVWSESPTSKQGEKVYINIRPQTVSEVQTSTSADLKPLDFYLWGQVKPSSVFSVNWKWRAFINRIFDVCQTIRSHPGTFESVRQSIIRSVHAGLIKMEDTLSVCCESWLDKR